MGEQRKEGKSYSWKFRNRIAYKIFIYFLALWLMFSAVVMGSLHTASIHLTKRTLESREDKITYYSSMINKDLERIIQLLYVMCGDNDVVKLVKNRSVDFEYDDYLNYLNAYNKLKNYQQVSMYIDDIYLYLPNTKELLDANKSIIPVDANTKQMFEQYVNTGKSFFSKGDKLNYIFQGANEVIMGITVSVKYISDTLKSLINQKNFEFFLIDSQEKKLLGKSTVSSMGRKIYQKMDKNRFSGEVTIGSEKYLIERMQTTENQFEIVIFTDKTILYSDITFIRNLWFIINMIALLVVIVMAVVISVQIHKPMKQLVYGMQQVEQENYDYILPLNETTEFRYVFNQYNHMASKIQELIRTVYEKQLQIQEYKMHQLQSQINPHFLFNSLYLGYRLAKAGEMEKTADLCMNLGEYFKVLTYLKNEDIALCQEIDFAGSYLKLNQMRFGERLKYHIDVDDKLEDLRVPHLMIQPLIENAISHGVEKVSKNCTIVLKVRNDKEFININVSDDCGLLDEENLEELRASLESKEQPSSSIGLWNIHQRLLGFDSKGLLLKLEDGKYIVSYKISKEICGHVSNNDSR